MFSVSGCSGALIVTTGVVEADLERLQPPQDRRADAPGGDAADLHALQVV
jgi:hypothetical protein